MNQFLKPTLMFIIALLVVDFLIFMRALSMNEMSTKSIIKTIFKVNAGFIIAAAFILFFANFITIMNLFVK